MLMFIVKKAILNFVTLASLPQRVLLVFCISFGELSFSVEVQDILIRFRVHGRPNPAGKLKG
jgi:hypothetical protein